MIFAIVIAAVSFIAIIAMVSVGLYEIKVGHKTIAVSARLWCDRHVQIALHAMRVVAQVASTKKFWTGLVSYIWQKFVEKVWHHPHVKKVVKKSVDVVCGKKEIKPTGTVSYYLKDVSEYKKDMPM